MKLKACITFSALLIVATVNAVVVEDPQLLDSTENSIEANYLKKPSLIVCPDFQLKCPTCKHGQKCVYPDSGGCSGAGIPICQSTKCHNILCLTKRLPCPAECPFSCRYSGPPCCPFNGEPVCEPVCGNFAPCQVTPCSSDCPGNCFYPDANYCCPKSGKAVCKRTLSAANVFSAAASAAVTASKAEHHEKRKGGTGYKSGGAPSINWGASYSAEAISWAASNTPLSEENGWGYDANEEYGELGYGFYNPNEGYGEFGNVAYGPNEDFGEYAHGKYNREYDHGGHHHGRHGEDHHHGHHHHGHEHEHHYHGDDDYFEGYYIPGDHNEHYCPTCTKTVTDIDISLTFVTTTRATSDIICAQYIVPCPVACPYNCIYPMDQPCPFTEQPWCPSVFDATTNEDECLYVTEGYPFPYFPTYDPYHSVFTSILNDSGVTSTPSFVTEIATDVPAHFCPLIMRLCPIECPDSCLRPDVLCPFAAEGYCPGSSPTTTALITPTESTFIGTRFVCPLYILACPYCPDGYTCTRATTGNCPNTNVPYCSISTMPEITYTSSSITPIFEYYPEPSPTPSLIFYQPPPYGYGGWKQKLHAQSLSVSYTPEQEELLDLDVHDVCARAGLAKVLNKQIFDQLQEKRIDCEHCEVLEWDDHCDNTCIYRTEGNCCIKAICLPN